MQTFLQKFAHLPIFQTGITRFLPKKSNASISQGKGTLPRALKCYSSGVQLKDRISPVFSFFCTFAPATFTRDWYLSFLGPDLE